jgi:dTDP-4-dehydrorhamnose 3,5-epimerase
MRFEPQAIEGLLAVHPDRHADMRGYFTRTFCRDTFRQAGLADCCLQMSLSHNAIRGTLRGMHVQRPPYGETKLVRCSRGRVYDVAVDVRPGSATLGRWIGLELSAESGIAFYIPQGFAHGFVTLEDASDLVYQMAEPFVAEASAGFRFDDPDVGINWPLAPTVMSDRDRALPSLSETFLG